MPRTAEQRRERRLEGTALAALVKKLPLPAQERMRYFRRSAARDFDSHGVYLAAGERLRQRIQNQKAKIALHARSVETQRRALRPDGFRDYQARMKPEIDEAQEELRALEDEMAKVDEDHRNAPNDGGCYADNCAFLTAHQGRKFRDVAPVPYEPGENTQTLKNIRADIAGIQARFEAIDNAPVALADIEAKLDHILNQCASGGTPEVWALTRLFNDAPTGRGERVSQGGVKWPTAFVGGKTFAPSGVDFLIWAFKEEIRAKMLALIESKMPQNVEPIAIADRPALKAKLESEMLALERKECSLVWDLQGIGEVVAHRMGCDVRALLGIDFDN